MSEVNNDIIFNDGFTDHYMELHYPDKDRKDFQKIIEGFKFLERVKNEK